MLIVWNSFKIDTHCPDPIVSCPDAIMTFSSSIIDEISGTRAVSFDPVLCILNGPSTEPYPASFETLF